MLICFIYEIEIELELNYYNHTLELEYYNHESLAKDWILGWNFPIPTFFINYSSTIVVGTLNLVKNSWKLMAVFKGSSSYIECPV